MNGQRFWKVVRILLLLSQISAGACTPVDQGSEASAASSPPPLEVSENGRFLVQRLTNGEARPFFWLGDTAWNLHRLTAEEIDHYLEDRAAKGFNVIQGPVLDWTGLTDKQPLSLRNAYDQAAYRNKESLPELNADVAGDSFNDYFDQTDYIIDRAAGLGMYVALLPFWAQGINDLDGEPEQQARLERVGELLGARYRGRSNVLWIVAGESAGESRPEGVIALARGLERGHGGDNLMTVHPGGAKSSSSGPWRAFGEGGRYDYHQQPWLDFNMLQSGHGVSDRATYLLIDGDYRRAPAKPTLEAEYWYEGGYPNQAGKVSTAYDQRKGAYWSVFAGGFGFTYGANGIWQLTAGDEDWDADDYPSVDDWRTALRYEGSGQMIHLRRLMESHPFLNRIPDQSLILSGAGGSGEGSADHVRATRDGTAGARDATYLMVYIPTPAPVTVDTRAIASGTLNAWWHDPRTGRQEAFREGFPNTGQIDVPARPDGPDWVLVIEAVEPEVYG